MDTNELLNMSAEELEKEYDRLWRNAWYFAAAEGNWQSETLARNANEQKLNAVEAEMRRRGIQ